MVDRNPKKQGLFTPGAHIPIFAPERIFETKPDYVLILPWNIKDEVMEQYRKIEERITSRTKAILPVHFAGQACDMAPLLEMARRRGLPVVEDAAHAIPTRYQGRLIGTFGDITCFSFYATKNLTTGEGGMATTEDADIARRVRTGMRAEPLL